MAISNEQLQRLKKSQAIAQKHCEKMGGKLANPIDFDLLEQYQEKHQKVELDQQTIKDIEEQVKQAIDKGLKDVFK